MSLLILTLFHTAISFIAMGIGIIAVYALLKPINPKWITRFLILALSVTITGYFFPFNGITPAFITGIVALIFLAITYMARYRFHFNGHWRWLYATGIVANLYLLVFVTIAQAFLKIPPLTALAPTGTEPPFAIAQLINLALFIYIGLKTAKAFRPLPIVN